MDGQKPTLNDVAMYFDDAGIRSTKEDSYAATVRAASEVLGRCYNALADGLEPPDPALIADIHKLIGGAK